jgi:hypothetical protein
MNPPELEVHRAEIEAIAMAYESRQDIAEALKSVAAK